MLRESRGAVGFGSRDERLAGNRQMEEDDPKSAFVRPNEKGAVVQSGRVVQIIALVKPFRAQAVLAALESVEVLGGTVREAMGYGRQKNRLHQYLGSEYNSSFVPKVELTVFVEQEHAQAAIKAIVGQARTGRIGDGKILVIHCLEEFLSW
jgi:nitrogen regulatory protein P-II 1